MLPTYLYKVGAWESLESSKTQCKSKCHRTHIGLTSSPFLEVKPMPQLGNKCQQENRATIILKRNHSSKESNLLDQRSITAIYLPIIRRKRHWILFLKWPRQSFSAELKQLCTSYSKFKVGSKVTNRLAIPLSHTRTIYKLKTCSREILLSNFNFQGNMQIWSKVTFQDSTYSSLYVNRH